MNKIQKGKAWLIGLGALILIAGIGAIVGMVFCIINGVADASHKWWLFIIAFVLLILAIPCSILGFVWVWTGCAMTATKTDKQMGNVPVEEQEKSGELKCEKCGTVIEPGATHCTNCGTRNMNKKICMECGTENKRSSKCCSNCGKPLE